jgi:hypothetical protein
MRVLIGSGRRPVTLTTPQRLYLRLLDLQMTRLMTRSVATKQFDMEAFRRLDNLRYMACRFASFPGASSE